MVYGDQEDATAPKTTTYQTPLQAQAARRRHQGIGNKVWLVVSDKGDAHLDEVSKYQIMARTGLPARDLRALDPMLSYPSLILGRERAIVVNLEHIKAIITATEVLMVNSATPFVAQFAKDLQDRISGKYQQAKESGDPYIICEPDAKELKGRIDESALKTPLGSKSLPFEFRALEVCLESACQRLEGETSTLEQEAYPTLDELTSQISTLNLDRVRHIKSRLVALSGRVQKVRDEIEHLLDDDNDMAEMYLTEKLQESMEQTSMKEDPDSEPVEPQNAERDDDDVSRSSRSSDNLTYAKPNVEELEMLLEAYFAQVDGISQKLSTMSEYVGDTEDYVNIMLDDKQNQLLQTGVMLGTANMIINAGIVVVGLFGMNIAIPLYDGVPAQFWATASGTVGGCILLYSLALGWGRKRYLFSM